jgi:ADP-ribose pyrophosphatase YjhB (NUDIX family)
MESFEECAQRELQEELNLNVDIKDIKYLTVLNVLRKDLNFHYVNIFTVTRIDEN